MIQERILRNSPGLKRTQEDILEHSRERYQRKASSGEKTPYLQKKKKEEKEEDKPDIR